MSKDDYLSEKEVAEILRIAPSTLQKNRSLGKQHPPFIKLGGTILYPKKELEAWLKAQPIRREIKAG